MQQRRTYNLSYFSKNLCPRKNHFCDGKHIPEFKGGVDISEEKDIGKCQYRVNGECMHPQRGT
jgi:hypothetical protein